MRSLELGRDGTHALGIGKTCLACGPYKLRPSDAYLNYLLRWPKNPQLYWA